MTGLRLLLDSPLREKYRFHSVFQTRPAGGLNLKLVWEMAREIRDCNPALFHVRGLQNEGFHGVLAGKLAGCRRIVVSVHGSIGELHSVSPLKRLLFQWIIEPLTLHLADRFYCVCHAQAGKLTSKKNFAGVIHNASPVFSPGTGRDTMRKNLGIADTDVACVFVGRLTEEKGLLYLAEAMTEILASKIPTPLKFIIVGDGPLEESFRERFVSDHIGGRVAILGRRDDVQDILAASDIFVFPTLHENLSNALLEACAAGLAIVATEVGGNPEVIRNEMDGILVPPGNAMALQASLLILAENPELRNSLGKAARKRALTEFSQRVLWSRIDTLYDKVLGEKTIS